MKVYCLCQNQRNFVESTNVLLRNTLLGKRDIELLKSMPCDFRTFRESLLQQIHSCIRLSSVFTYLQGYWGFYVKKDTGVIGE